MNEVETRDQSTRGMQIKKGRCLIPASHFFEREVEIHQDWRGLVLLCRAVAPDARCRRRCVHAACCATGGRPLASTRPLSAGDNPKNSAKFLSEGELSSESARTIRTVHKPPGSASSGARVGPAATGRQFARDLYGAFSVKRLFWVCGQFFVRSGKAVLRPVACDQVPGARGRGQGTETLA